MAISKTQPMRPAEIELVDVVNGYSSTISNVEAEMEQVNESIATLVSDMDTAQTDIGTLQTDLASTNGNVTELQGDMTSAESDIAALQTGLASTNGNVTELQGDMTSAESDIAALQTAINALASVETSSYLEYISVASGSGMTINSATLTRWGKVCLLMVNYTLDSANAITSGNWKNIFDITGPYAPIAGNALAAAVNDKSAVAMINNTNALWIKALNANHSGTHYAGAIYLTN